MVKVKPSVLKGAVQAPPSKSYTHRAVVLASLCDGESTVENPLISGDTSATIKACQAMGAKIESRESYLYTSGVSDVEAPSDVIDAGNSGTTMRFMTAVSSLVKRGFTVLSGDESIRRRPMQPLLDALHGLGVECWSTRLNGLPPVLVKGGRLKGGYAEIRGDVSSQFISAILIAAPKAEGEIHLKAIGRVVSEPYIEATLRMIQAFGGMVGMDCRGEYHVVPSRYSSIRFRVPGDWSSASFILAGAALTGGNVVVEGVDFSLPQADMRILDILKQMNVSVKIDKEGGSVTVEKEEGTLGGGEFDLSNSPDLLPVVSVLALKARGRVVVKGVEHTRFKESDRVAVIAEELGKFGAQVEELRDGLSIQSTKDLKSCLADAHGDHRVFMALSLAGMVTPGGCLIEGAESVQISYPDFMGHILSLGGNVEEVKR